MADRRCDNCGAERGVEGPCPGCGALPAVQLVELDQQAPGEVRRATAADAPQRRVALGVVLVLVALVASSIVWDSIRTDGTEAAGDAAGADDEEDDEQDDAPATTSTTRPSSTAPGSPDPGDGPGDGAGPSTSVAPVEGFEDRWLLVVNQNSGAVWQLPLGGGEMTRILDRTNRPLSHSIPPGFHVLDDMLINHDGGMSLTDGSRWSFRSSDPDGGWGSLAGITENDTLVFFGDSLSERTPTGQVISEWDALGVDDVMNGRVTHVAGRTALVSSPHGVYALDLDSQEGRLVLDGSYIVADQDVVVGEACTGWQQCETRVVEIGTGDVVATIESADLFARPTAPPLGHGSEPKVSPDGERLVFVVDDRVELVDLTSGGRLGTFDLPPIETGLGHDLVQVLWAPDSSAALVYVTPRMFSGSSTTPALLRIDRNFRNVEPLDELLDAMHEGADRGLAIVLSDRPFEPGPNT